MIEINQSCYPEITKIKHAPTVEQATIVAQSWRQSHQDKHPSFLVEIWSGEHNQGEPIWAEGQDFDEWDPEPDH